MLALCRRDNDWPGWEVCASWFKKEGETSVEPEAPTTPNKGLLTPTWQRFKVTDDEYGDRIYHFTCDVAASKTLAKCKHYYDKEMNGLQQTWEAVCWMNPPYSDLSKWVKKVYEWSRQGAVVVVLLPIDMDAVWFHDYASHATMELLKGRLQFANRPHKGYTPFGHKICVFRKRSARSGKRLTISLNGHRLGCLASRSEE